MNNRIIATSVCAATFAFAAVLTADARKPVNANGDAVVTGDEIATAYAGNKERRIALFNELDADNNSVLSEAEVGSKSNMKKLDTDGNGSVTQNEFLFEAAKGTTKALDKTDKNDDGQIDQGEAQTVLEKIKARRGK